MLTKKIVEKALKLKKPPESTHLAVLFRGNRMVGYAWNDKSKTKAICARYDFYNATLHAEVGVILSYLKNHSKKDLKKTNMLVLRFLKTGEFGASRPCDNCWAFMEEFPVQNVFWFDDAMSLRKE